MKQNFQPKQYYNLKKRKEINFHLKREKKNNKEERQ